ncbi:hypothetical protein EJ05DRAFT_528414 [Pseudovirgaria hyperparasitica]|uniref:Uncharacterized protein n=1 Tax=Pseudovirgaria hyperparasitica TaxID=470096 RepID=A0A6A6W612_9PEZI|nr:uncharacterized protein EJ05DRAFT_528414 [Pseudovirgaria hyperparasitica]KAF2757985.1 hypothetical protein EJ05DRAFT_528414 [Pseudovirgaria hyperparasitica]
MSSPHVSFDEDSLLIPRPFTSSNINTVNSPAHLSPIPSSASSASPSYGALRTATHAHEPPHHQHGTSTLSHQSIYDRAAMLAEQRSPTPRRDSTSTYHTACSEPPVLPLSLSQVTHSPPRSRLDAIPQEAHTQRQKVQRQETQESQDAQESQAMHKAQLETRALLRCLLPPSERRGSRVACWPHEVADLERQRGAGDGRRMQRVGCWGVVVGVARAVAVGVLVLVLLAVGLGVGVFGGGGRWRGRGHGGG